ncbi:thioesterase family protein [Pseudomonas sp. NPDC007930]|uniref:thioesterase family protein n=1 Tax=Pseudomonas sp. NPDC007930 TaxID=3364417 RepID=UPI0036EF91AF
MTEPLITWRGPVLAEWTDYNGHLRDAFYLLIFSYASDGFMAAIGLDAAGREATGCSLFTLECHLNFLHEVKQGEQVEVRTQVLGHDHKRVHLYFTLHRQGEEAELAASEQMLLHVSMAGPKSAPFGEVAARRLVDIVARQGDRPPAQWAGRVIRLPG